MATTLRATKGRLIRCLSQIDAKPQGLMDSFFPGRGLSEANEAVSLIPDSRKGGTGHRQKSLNRSGASSV